MSSPLNIAVRPFYADYLQNKLFKPEHSVASHWMAPLVKLKEAAEQRGWQMNTWDVTPLEEADVVLMQDLPRREEFDAARKRARKAKFILHIWETPLSRPLSWNAQNHSYFDAVITYDSHLVDNKKYFHFWLPLSEPPLDLPDPPFAQRGMMVLINNNRSFGLLAHRQRGWAGIPFFGHAFSGWHVTPLEILQQDRGEQYSHRRHVARLAEKQFPSVLDLYGAGWQGDSMSWLHRFIKPRPYANAKGPSKGEKLPILTQYRFVLAFENMVADRGYISEKMFDALYAGAVPVYLGDERVTDLVPADCFVDARQFNGDDRKLLQYVQSCDEETWNRYREAGKRFLQSEPAKVVQPTAFVSNMMKIIETVTGTTQLPSHSAAYPTNEARTS